VYDEVEYSCDKLIRERQEEKRCRRKPYAEVYPSDRHTWSYLCRWHYYIDVLKGIIFRKPNGYYILDENDEEDRYGLYNKKQ